MPDVFYPDEPTVYKYSDNMALAVRQLENNYVVMLDYLLRCNDAYAKLLEESSP